MRPSKVSQERKVKTMKTNKYAKLKFVFLGLGSISLIGSIVFTVLSILKLGDIFSILAIVFIGLFICFCLIGHICIIKAKGDVREDLAKINESLEAYSKGKKEIIQVKGNDQKVIEIANKINDLNLLPRTLSSEVVYDKDTFLPYAKLVLESDSEVEKFAFIRFTKMPLESKEFFKNLANPIYFGKNNDGFDMILCNYVNEKDIKELVEQFLSDKPESKAIISFYPRVTFEEIEPLTNEALNKEDRIIITQGNEYTANSFNEVLDFYLAKDLNDESLLTSFMRDMLPFTSFTHMALVANDKFIRQVNYNDSKKFAELDTEEFKYLSKDHILKFEGKDVYVYLASLEPIEQITHEEKDRIRVFEALLAALVVPHLTSEANEIMKDRFENLLNITKSYAFSIDDQNIITYANKSLHERLHYKSVGEPFYKAIYGLDSAEATKILEQKETKSIITKLGSRTYTNVVNRNHDAFDVYILSNGNNVVSSKEELQEKLLSLINNDQRGYLLCFKFEGLSDLAKKNKVTESFIVNELYKVLSGYNLDGNLYHKETDEFVYLIEDVIIDNAIELSRRLASALEERLLLSNEKGSPITPKVLLLSYPLEVSTLFDLDSLSRTMYKTVDKKGRLYRIARDPLPIDKRKYYTEIIEESFKHDAIPLSFVEVKDVNDGSILKEIHFDYHNEEGDPINEMDVTLYTKQENLYLTLLERTIRQLNFEENEKYILPLHREGLVPALIITAEKVLKSKKAPTSSLIFDVPEGYLYKNKDFYNVVIEKGFGLGVGAIELKEPKGIENIQVVYYNINGDFYNINSVYAHRISNLINAKEPMRIKEKYLDIAHEAKFIG